MTLWWKFFWLPFDEIHWNTNGCSYRLCFISHWTTFRLILCLKWQNIAIWPALSTDQSFYVSLTWNAFEKMSKPTCVITAHFVCFPQHPVYCVNVVGTQNAHNLISVSTDGKMCSWSLDMLSQPQVYTTVQAGFSGMLICCTFYFSVLSMLEFIKVQGK